MLAFYIAQFFPSLNHQLLPIILDKAGFDSRISSFFSSYLINRQGQYFWNNFVSSFSREDVGMGQGSALFYLYFILLQSFTFLKKELIVFYLLFLFPLFLSLIVVFSFLRKKTMKNQMLIYFVVSFLLFSNNSVLWLNITNWRFFIFLE